MSSNSTRSFLADDSMRGTGINLSATATRVWNTNIAYYFFLFLITPGSKNTRGYNNNFLIPPVVRIPGVKSKNVKNIKSGWNGYVSVSSSSKKVSRNKTKLKHCTSTLTLWKRNWAGLPMVRLNGLWFCGPVLREKKPWCRSVAHVTQLPLADTHEWKTVQCIMSISCRQLIRHPHLLYDLPRSSRKQLPWCRLWHSMLNVAPPPHYGIRVQTLGRFLSLWTRPAGNQNTPNSWTDVIA